MIEFLLDIEKHLESEYPREGCGILAIVKGKLNWYPCTNVAKDNNDFIIDSTQYMKLNRTTDIIGIIHSHPDRSPEPSINDINNCNALGIPYYIFSFPQMEMVKVEPIKNLKPLIGREYIFGSQDCFEASKDYYKEYCGINLRSRDAFENYWWERGLDYFNEQFLRDWGFQKLDNLPQKYDLLLFTINSPVANHCGVTLENNVFFHHASNRLSCRENLNSFWMKHLTGVYRYVT